MQRQGNSRVEEHLNPQVPLSQSNKGNRNNQKRTQSSDAFKYFIVLCLLLRDSMDGR
jgi:hypothetical protein